MIDKPCPWCNTVQTVRVTRTDSGCVEWECSGCGKRWTVKDGHPGVAFVHWPGDLAAAFDDTVKPLFADVEGLGNHIAG
jgi:hypothetical protein